MILNFGVHAGKEIDQVPLEYLKWLAKPKAYTKNRVSTEITFSVPFAVRAEARRVLEERGYVIIGERIEKARE